jgi:hypothetical protein
VTGGGQLIRTADPFARLLADLRNSDLPGVPANFFGTRWELNTVSETNGSNLD